MKKFAYLLLCLSLFRCSCEKRLETRFVCGDTNALNYGLRPNEFDGDIEFEFKHKDGLCDYGRVGVTSLAADSIKSTGLTSDGRFMFNKYKLGETLQFNAAEYNRTAFPNPTYNWVFESGTPATSTDSLPIVTFNSAGLKNVELTINNRITIYPCLTDSFSHGCFVRKVLIVDDSQSDQPKTMYNVSGSCTILNTFSTVTITDNDSIIEIDNFHGQYNNVMLQANGGFGTGLINLTADKQIKSYTVERESGNNFKIFYFIEDNSNNEQETCNLLYSQFDY